MSEMNLSIGYGRIDITPLTDQPLRGVGNSHMRMPNVFLDPLYATCLAFTDEAGNAALIYTCDQTIAWGKITEALREKVLDKFGIPAENVIIANTHTHSAPDVTVTPEYNEWYGQRLLEAAAAALADRKPGTMEIGRSDNTQNLNFVRHYFLDENGKSCAHKAEPDHQMQVVKITREGGKSIMLMNWQSHPCWGMKIHRNGVSADYIGSIRRYVESKTDMLFAFYQGAAGNIASKSRIKAENITNDMDLYGGLLAERALAALENTAPISGGPVRGVQETVTLTVDHTDDHRVADAQIITKYWAETNDRKGSDEMGKPYDIHSPYHAGSIIKRSKMPQTEQMTIGAVRAGDLAFTWAPYEMFCENGKYIKEESPFDDTFVLTVSNARHSYVASKQAFDYGCYEYDTRDYIRGTGEFLAETFVKLLEKIR